jgi:hypothetical protein
LSAVELPVDLKRGCARQGEARRSLAERVNLKQGRALKPERAENVRLIVEPPRDCERGRASERERALPVKEIEQGRARERDARRLHDLARDFKKGRAVERETVARCAALNRVYW